jgi:hypothetical protein
VRPWRYTALRYLESIMDIQRWLKETAEAGPPPIPVKDPGSAFFPHNERARLVFEEKHAQKRSKSDSSLLVPQPHSHVAPAKEPKLSIGKATDASACSEASRSSRNGSTESESSSQRYARRPRRKTRPERYEPKPNKERGKHIHQSRKDESKKSRRKFKRKKGEKSDSGVAQSFHAKNVSRDRLTVRAAGHAVLCDSTDDWVVAEAERASGSLQQGQDFNGCSGPWT